MIAYKIATLRRCCLGGDGYYSYGSGLYPEDTLCLKYVEGEITQACEGTIGIFLYDNLEDAYRNAIGINARIFKIETLTRVKKPTKILAVLRIAGGLFIRREYKRFLRKPDFVEEYTLPNSTILCMKVRVLEKLPKILQKERT